MAWLSSGAEPAWLGPRLWEMLQHPKTSSLPFSSLPCSSLPCAQVTAAAPRNTTPPQHQPKWNLESAPIAFLFLYLVIFKRVKLSLAENEEGK